MSALALTAPTSTAPTSRVTTDEPRITVVSLLDPAPDDGADWLGACYSLTPRVAPLSPTSAALDLGPCTEQEALHAAHGLTDHLRWAALHVRIGIGPTLPVAHLAALTGSPSQRIALIPAAAVSSFLRPLPIASLCALHLPLPITAETVYRLRRSGVTTLGQLARLDERTLRRQFGAVGALLASLAHGAAPTPFHPTPLAPALRFRTRFPTPLRLEETLRRLPQLAEEIAARLRTRNQTTGALALTVCWDTGGVARAQETLREPMQDAAPLTQRLEHLFTSLLRSPANAQMPQLTLIEWLEVRLTALAPLQPRQNALWSTPRPLRDERLRRTRALAETLAQRQRRPVLLTARQTHEDAIFSEDGYTLTPLTAETASTAHAPRLRTSSRPPDRWRDAPIQPHWW
jgi:impB/mucB/samB family C-terminal domain